MSPEEKSAAPEPPHLRVAPDGSSRQCATCKMYDDGVCWGYGNYPVQRNQLCDSYVRDPEARQADGPYYSEDDMNKTEPDELRAKYQTADREKMARAGEAMSDGSFPVVDLEDLKTSIRAISRGSEDHDGTRRHIIVRARDLGHSDLLPDNWNRDGALADRSGEWSTEEERETYNDLALALSNALSDGLDGYGWVQDFGADTVYYYSSGCIYEASYNLTTDGPQIGDGQRVRPVTTYVPAERSEPKSKRRRFAVRTQEQRKERATSLSETQRRRSDSRPAAAPLELRGEGDEQRVLFSYASLFDTPYSMGSGSYRYEESVNNGAFKRSLSANPDVVFRTEHSGPPLAATWNGTLRLGEDQRGLWYEADLNPRDPDAQALIPKVERGDMRESSFAFRCIQDTWNDDYSKRALNACELDRGDVSVVTFGASRGTGRHMALRFEESIEALRSIGFEAFLEAWVEWRNYTLLPPEARAGKILSSTSMDTLRRVLDLVAAADDAVDDAQPLLADLMGVPNPDADDDDDDDDDVSDGSEAAELAEDPEGQEKRKDYSSDQREKMAKKGTALPDGSFPISNRADLANAIQAVGRAKDPAAAKAHIKKRASALGATDMIPDGWRAEPKPTGVPSSRLEEFEIELRTVGGR